MKSFLYLITTMSFLAALSYAAVRTDTVYFKGSSSGYTGLQAGASAGNNTFKLPTADGSAGQILQTNGSGQLSWANNGGVNQPADITNLGISAAIPASDLVISLRGSDGNDPSGSNVVYAAMRDGASAVGTTNRRSISSALSLTITAGSSLGFNVSDSYVEIWVYLVDSDGAGTMKLAVSATRFDDGSLQTTVAEGEAGGADSATVLYSDAAYTSKPIRVIGRVKAEVMSGTWTIVDEVSLVPYNKKEVVTNVSSADHTATKNDDFIAVTTGASDRTITLVNPISVRGRRLTIKKVDSGTGCVVGGSYTIDGVSNRKLCVQNDYWTMESNGTSYYLVASSEKIVARYTSTSTAGTSTSTPIVFETKVEDAYGAVATSPWKFTAPVGACYGVNAQAYFGAGIMRLYKNGAYYSMGTYGTSDTVSALSDVVCLAAGEYLDMRTADSETMAGSANNTFISVFRIGD